MSDLPPSTEAQELAEIDQQAQRPSEAPGVEFKVFDAVRSQVPNPVEPVRLKPDDTFRFRCHRGVSCWNVCCHGADVTLTPYDIVRLCRRLGIRAREFLARYAVPAFHDHAGMPVAKLKMGGADGKGPCSFLAEEGCTVYADRPASCRYYPLGVVSMQRKDGPGTEDFCFIVREPHCRGHDEAKTQTVAEFRDEQGVDPYDRIDRGWTDILMKLASWKCVGGPQGKAPSPQTMKMFFLASTDVDEFRRFVFESRFLDTYVISPEALELIKTDDAALLQLGFDWLKNVLFNEPTINMKEEVLQRAIATARSELGGA
ncbi:MAG: YkgJ family cysteine cluster protein [Pseudomonadota bacterium]